MSEQQQPGWAVVMTKSMAEEVAAKSLLSAGWRTYLPRFRRMLLGVRIDPRTGRKVRTRGHGAIVMRPVFTGYIFAELHPDQEWYDLLSQRGVSGVLNTGGDRARARLLSAYGIEVMRADEMAGKYDDPRCRRNKPTNRPDLRVGDLVGLELDYCTFEATIRQLDPNDTAVVEWMIFGRPTRTRVSTTELELVSA